MRLITRSDFDGLVCAVLLQEVEQIDSVEFVHPEDVQDGKITVTPDDILTNLPYAPGSASGSTITPARSFATRRPRPIEVVSRSPHPPRVSSTTTIASGEATS